MKIRLAGGGSAAIGGLKVRGLSPRQAWRPVNPLCYDPGGPAMGGCDCLVLREVVVVFSLLGVLGITLILFVGVVVTARFLLGR